MSANSELEDDDYDIEVDEPILPSSASIYAVRAYRLPDPKVTEISKRMKRISTPLEVRHRRFIKEGIVHRSGKWNVVERNMILLSDVLLFAKVLSDLKEVPLTQAKLQLKQVLQLEGMEVDIRPNIIIKYTKLPHSFILYVRLPKTKNYVVSCDSAAERDEWLNSIQLAVSRGMWARKDPKCADFGWYLSIVKGTLHWTVLHDSSNISSIIAEDNAIVTSIENKKEKKDKLVNRRDQEGMTALHVAARLNLAPLIPILLQAGATISIKDNELGTPVHVAAKYGHLDALNMLLCAPDVTVSLYHPLPSLSASKLSSSASSTVYNYSATSAIWLAALNHPQQFESCIKALLRHSKEHDINAKDILNSRDYEKYSLVETAAMQNVSHPIGFLATLGTNIDAISPVFSCTPISIAAQRGNFSAVKAFIQSGGQPNMRSIENLNCCLHYASTFEIALYLVSHGARMYMRNRQEQRVVDIYGTPENLVKLEEAAQNRSESLPLETEDVMRPYPTTVAMNGGHSLDSCYCCQDELRKGLKDIAGGIVTGKRRSGWCPRCGFAMCKRCLTMSLVFVSSTGGSDETAAVCDGCYNKVLYRKSVKEDRRKNQEQEQLNTTSLFSFSNLASFLTSVQVNQPTQQLLSPTSIVIQDPLGNTAAQGAKQLNQTVDYASGGIRVIRPSVSSENLSNQKSQVGGTSSSVPESIPRPRSASPQLNRKLSQDIKPRRQSPQLRVEISSEEVDEEDSSPSPIQSDANIRLPKSNAHRRRPSSTARETQLTSSSPKRKTSEASPVDGESRPIAKETSMSRFVQRQLGKLESNKVNKR